MLKRLLTWNSKLLLTAVWELSQGSPLQEAALASSQDGGWLPRVSVPRSMKCTLTVSKGLEPQTGTAQVPKYSINQNSHRAHPLDGKDIKEFVAFFNLHIWCFQSVEDEYIGNISGCALCVCPI